MRACRSPLPGFRLPARVGRVGRWLRAFFGSSVTVLFLTAAQVCAAGESSGLRTEPPIPLAGQPFHVVADGRMCLLLFNDQLYGPGYERVTLAPGVIRVRIGFYSEAVFTGLSCSATGPHTVRVLVPGQPAGPYRLELLGRSLFGPDESEFLEAIEVVVSTVEPISVPSGGRLSAGALALVLLFVVRRRMLGGDPGLHCGHVHIETGIASRGR